ncbi:flagellar basal body P-ring formation chaperone FlgA [Bradyrhizobium prioriisuperbiae]|uniref:flagellar basal body P-ring formation chaperone FlgA n=1 Tax=Bradyrhizobium prioriisuperbiae TaxID=2854389 RepID=UPI0028EAEBA6|nr:flagellar basal body P-ring formation chaperone FlgA [Bradyrhizobium prioritasuperba]
MALRTLLITSLLLGSCVSALAQSDTVTDAAFPTAVTAGVLATPVLRPTVTVSGDVVRIGDVIDNAGPAAQIAIYRAPDLGTTGSISATQVLATLRAHQVIGVDARDIREISVTRLSRTLASKDVEQRIAALLERRNGLGEAANITVTFDRELRALQLDPATTGDLQPASTRFDPRNGRFDILFELANTNSPIPTRLRFTGTAVETVEVGVLVRSVDRNEILRSSDVVVERRPRQEVGNDPARRERAVGMQTRKAMRAGQAIRLADLAKPDLVQRDQIVTLIYQSDGLYLTMRAKATENGSEGDTVSVINTQSKRTLQGVVTGPSQVSVIATTPRILTTAAVASPAGKPSDVTKAE